MKFSNQLSITIMICTFNRRNSLLSCLNSIKNQSVLPNQLVIVEKIVNNGRRISEKELKLLFGKSTQVSYKKILAGNISVSRNIALSLAKEDILLFIDDDVLLETQYVEKLLRLYNMYPKGNFIVGDIRAQESSYWQNFSLKLITACTKNENKPVKVLHWPTMNFSFRRLILNKYNLSFDEKYSGLEDMAFCLKISKLGQKIYYFPNLYVIHSFRNNLFSFISSFQNYFKNIDYLYEDYPKFDLFNRSLYKESVFMPIKILNDSIKITKDYGLSFKYFFAFFVHHYLVLHCINNK